MLTQPLLFCSAYTKGNNLHDKCVLARLSDGSVPITRVSLPTFAKHPQHTSKAKKVSSLKRDAYLVSHIFLPLQSRPYFDLDDLFQV